MIKCQGTLRIKRIRQSRNGAFCIADLNTDFGEFKVKDPMLDQFDEGEYQGTIWISEIYLSQYIAYGKAVTELRARLHDLNIDSEDHKPVRSNEHSEPDPMDEVPTPQIPKKAAPGPQKHSTWASVKSNKLSKAANPGQPTEDQEAGGVARTQEDAGKGVDSSVELFGQELAALIDKRQPVKLDPTVDRMLLRTQAASLRSKGYVFDAKQQAWNHQAS